MPDVAMDDDGDFVVTWREFTGPSSGGCHQSRIAFRRYSASGIARDNTPKTATLEGGYECLEPASVAMDADGDFAIAFSIYLYQGPFDCVSSGGTSVLRYSASGVFLGRNSVSEDDGTSEEPCTYGGAIAMESDGDFIVAYDFYESYFQGDSDVFGTAVRRYDAAGNRKEESYLAIDGFRANDIAVNELDEFILTGFEFGRSGVVTHRYAGAFPMGPPQQVNAGSSGFHRDSRVGLANDGSFTVAWERLTPDMTNSEIFRRSFTSSGIPISGDVRVNTYTTKFQDDPALAVNADGSFVVAWESQSQDGSGDGIYAQRHAGLGSPLPTAQFTLASAKVKENVGTVKVSVVLSSTASRDVTIPISLGGNATVIKDYKKPAASVVIPAGRTSANLSVMVVNDTQKEGDEIIALTMETPVNAALGSRTSHRLTILAND